MRQIFTVEALRGGASLSVAWFHLTNGYPADWVRHSGGYGWLGVTMFFVISGFIIPYSLHLSKYEITNFPRFLLRRLVRLEPPYLVSIALVIVLWELAAMVPGFAGGAPHYSLGQVLAHFLYLIPLTKHGWLCPVYWSLAYELVFYLLVGLLWPLLARKHLIFTAFIVAAFMMAAMGLSAKISNGAPLLFFAGICAARGMLNIDPRWLTYLAISSAAGAVWLTDGSEAAVIAFLTPIFILHVDVPRSRVLGFLGAISYSLYLVHVPIGGRVVNLGGRFIEGPAQELALSVLALLVSIAAATAFWWFIEEPARRVSRLITWQGGPGREERHLPLADRAR